MIITSASYLDRIPGEPFLISCLQKNVAFSVSNKILKKGKLLLFRRIHYFVQMSLLTEKGTRENIELPIPYKVEDYTEDGLLYFDYRLKSLEVKSLPQIPDKVSSVYFNKILEIQAIGTHI